MKKDIHPEYRPVVFLDLTSGEKFIVNSTATSRDNTTLEDGTEAPLIKLDVTSASHPFYTGKQTILDTAGRVEKFKQRQAVGQKAQRAANRKAAE